jgi:uncharacterized caspase-like protein
MLRLLAILLACIVAGGSPAPAAAQPAGGDGATTGLAPLRKQNPLVDDVARYDPDGLRNLLSKLEFLIANHGAPARTGSPPTAAEAAQITANPAFGLAYKSDPGGTLVLLRETNEALRKARLGVELGQPGRLALVVGDSGDAVWGKLGNTRNDAELIARTLKVLGFDLVTGGALIDPDRPHLQQAIKDFGHSIGPETAALFYYAGHGIQYEGNNYLVPVGAALPRRDDDYDNDLVQVDDTVLRQMQEAGGRLNIIVLDACRDHPPAPIETLTEASRGGRQYAQGLAASAAPAGMNGTVIIYSTAPNDIARDGINAGDTNSPFAKAFAAAIVRPGIDMRDAFDEIQDAVRQDTHGAQQPWISYAAIGKFFFADQPTVQQAASRIPLSASPPGLPTPPTQAPVSSRPSIIQEQRNAWQDQQDKKYAAVELANGDRLWNYWTSRCQGDPLVPGTNCSGGYFATVVNYRKAMRWEAAPNRSSEIESRIQSICNSFQKAGSQLASYSQCFPDQQTTVAQHEDCVRAEDGRLYCQ